MDTTDWTWAVTGAILLAVWAFWIIMAILARSIRAVIWWWTDNPHARQARLVERSRRVRQW